MNKRLRGHLQDLSRASCCHT